jgi:two-component system sensor histidine kinase PilS (NtrC family)
VGALKNRAYALSLLVEADSNPKAAAQIASMDGELDRIERIVRDFLRYARPSDPRLAACSVAGIAESFHRDFSGEMAARGVSFQVHVENDTVFQADAQQVRQVLLNLTRNAADACSGQENARITLHASTAAGRVIFAVTDNGPGLSEEATGHLFVPFATSKRGGTGLGLAVSRAIARKHGGDLILSGTGQGVTRFELHLPA